MTGIQVQLWTGHRESGRAAGNGGGPVHDHDTTFGLFPSWPQGRLLEACFSEMLPQNIHRGPPWGHGVAPVLLLLVCQTSLPPLRQRLAQDSWRVWLASCQTGSGQTMPSLRGSSSLWNRSTWASLAHSAGRASITLGVLRSGQPPEELAPPPASDSSAPSLAGPGSWVPSAMCKAPRENKQNQLSPKAMGRHKEREGKRRE